MRFQMEKDSEKRREKQQKNANQYKSFPDYFLLCHITFASD